MAYASGSYISYNSFKSVSSMDCYIIWLMIRFSSYSFGLDILKLLTFIGVILWLLDGLAWNVRVGEEGESVVDLDYCYSNIFII